MTSQYGLLTIVGDADIIEWITPADGSSDHSEVIRQHQKGTCQWFLDLKKFQVWVEESNKTLFCPGIPGAGKTVLTAVVIESLMTRFRNEPDVGIAYFYCNFRLEELHGVESVLSSLLKQLTQGCSSLPQSVTSLYDRLEHTGRCLKLYEIVGALQSVAALYSRVFIIVDALDECQSRRDRHILTEAILALQSECGANIFVTSRLNITDMLGNCMLIEVRARDNDMRRYLDGHIFRLPDFVHHDLGIQEEIKAAIVQSAEGMSVAL